MKDAWKRQSLVSVSFSLCEVRQSLVARGQWLVSNKIASNPVMVKDKVPVEVFERLRVDIRQEIGGHQKTLKRADGKPLFSCGFCSRPLRRLSDYQRTMDPIQVHMVVATGAKGCLWHRREWRRWWWDWAVEKFGGG